MKIRTDFVTNSSSSSFILEIEFKLTNGEEIYFKGEGATPETGTIDYFDEEAVIIVSPRQLGLAKNIDELINLLQKGVLSGEIYEIEEGNLKDAQRIFEKSDPREEYDFEEEETVMIDAYNFIKEIQNKVKNMNEIETITVTGNEENYYTWNRKYTYNLKTKEYILEEEGEDPQERQDSAGGTLIFKDAKLAKLIKIDEEDY